MGELGQSLVPDAEDVLQTLVRAYADEWFAHYNFQLVAHALRGHRAPSVTDWVRRRSLEAWERADRLAERIAELGGELPQRLGDVVQRATDKPFKLPASWADVDGVLSAVLDAERTSLRTYETLWRAAGQDPLTTRLALDLLASAVRNEETIERLIGSTVPERDGR